jgi:uncharacterized protein (DUF111 family)
MFLKNGIEVELKLESRHFMIELKKGFLGSVLTVRAVDLDIEPQGREKYHTNKLQECINLLKKKQLPFNIQQRPDEILLWVNVNDNDIETINQHLYKLQLAGSQILMCYLGQLNPEDVNL